jgi:hypothetical protein
MRSRDLWEAFAGRRKLDQAFIFAARRRDRQLIFIGHV